MQIVLLASLVLGFTGVVAASVLYFVVKRFEVHEDPRIAEVEELLPGANCAACGRKGCHDFAVACCEAESLDGLFCPGAGEVGMRRIGEVVGLAAPAGPRMVARLLCGGSCDKRHRVAVYKGATTCEVAAMSSAGEMSCSYGCLGYGDCADACRFGAIKVDAAGRIARIDAELCTGCGACVKRCPRGVIGLAPYGVKGRRVWVACSNHVKAANARRACSVACLACGRCVKVCPFGAITIVDNLAVIDPAKCKLCRKCVAQCPTGAINTANFPQPLPQSSNHESNV